MTFADNSASVEGGGIYLVATASGRPAVTVTNSVFRDSYGSAVYNAGGELTLRNTTIGYNRPGNEVGGVFSDPAGNATTTLLNTLIANNSTSLAGRVRYRGVFTEASTANLIGVAAAGTTGLTHGVRGNLVGSPTAPLDAGLDDYTRPSA